MASKDEYNRIIPGARACFGVTYENGTVRQRIYMAEQFKRGLKAVEKYDRTHQSDPTIPEEGEPNETDGDTLP